MTSERCYTLENVVDEYLINRGVDKKKYYSRYITVAGRVWQDLFWNTLWVVKNKWEVLRKGEPYNYVDKPKDCVRLLSVNTVDDCGNIVPIFYNNRLNVIKKPSIKKCGCDKCDCGGLCEDVNGFTYTEKVLFTINGTEYKEKTWLKYCPNGDILEYREVPVKKYNDYIGDAGDYNNDYNVDYAVGEPPFSNFTVVTETFQRKICSLTVRPCGCPEETEENEKTLTEACGCFLPILSFRRKKHCSRFLDSVNDNLRGEVKLSECGTKIFYKPSRNWRKTGETKKNPDFLLINYQSDAGIFDDQVEVPDYALMAMWTGIDYRSKMFNNTYGIGEREEARIAYNRERNNVVMFLNPISLEFLANVQDAKIKW